MKLRLVFKRLFTAGYLFSFVLTRRIIKSTKGIPAKIIHGTRVKESSNVFRYKGNTRELSPNKYRSNVIDG